jgi:hypothetical protein
LFHWHEQLIRAFYIINIATYMINMECYFPCSILIYQFLDDLWDFPIKSLYFCFSTVWQKTSNISIFDITGATGLKKRQGQRPHFTNFETPPLGQRRTSGAQKKLRRVHQAKGPEGPNLSP